MKQHSYIQESNSHIPKTEKPAKKFRGGCAPTTPPIFSPASPCTEGIPLHHLIAAILSDGRKLGIIANAAGISQPVLSRILNGHTTPQKRTLFKLANVLGVDYWTLTSS